MLVAGKVRTYFPVSGWYLGAGRTMWTIRTAFGQLMLVISFLRFSMQRLGSQRSSDGKSSGVQLRFLVAGF